MPITTSTTERSLSALGQRKTHLFVTMVQDRLSSLALIHVRREMGIDTERVLRYLPWQKKIYGLSILTTLSLTCSINF